MKIAVEIPGALFREAKAFAADENLPLKQLVEAGLRKVLKEGKSWKKRFRLQDVSFGGQAQVADSDWANIRRLIYEEPG